MNTVTAREAVAERNIVYSALDKGWEEGTAARYDPLETEKLSDAIHHF